MAARSEVWRKVGGQAIRCTDCVMNHGSPVTNGEKPVGVNYICEAPDHQCVFLHYPLDDNEWHADFHDVYKDHPPEGDQE